jgi:hypothetical protein
VVEGVVGGPEKKEFQFTKSWNTADDVGERPEETA